MTTAAIRFTTDGDLYVPNCLALQIDSKGARLEAEKSADKAFAAVGEQINYTLKITNTGTLRAQTVSVDDLLPVGLQLVPGSVEIDGTPYAGGLPVTFGPLEAGASAEVTFAAVVNSVPAVNPAINIARADYIFEPFPGYPVNSSSDSNPVAVFIYDARMTVQKSVDKAFAVRGEELLYTSVVTNAGNVPLTSLNFTDPVPAGTSFVAGSVTVEGISFPAYIPAAGFPIGSLAPGRASR